MTPAIPKTYREMLAIVADADIFSWHREAKTVSLTFDDLPADRRTCLSLYMASAGPMRFGSSHAPPHPGMRPRKTSGSESAAAALDTVR